MYLSGRSKHVSKVFHTSLRLSTSLTSRRTWLATLLSLRLRHTSSSRTCPWYVCLYAYHSLRNRGYSTYFPLKVGHPLSFAWAFIMPRMRADSSPSSPVILGLGRDSAGGHVVVAGVCAGGHLGFAFPAGSLGGGGAETRLRPLAGIPPPTLGLCIPSPAALAAVAGP